MAQGLGTPLLRGRLNASGPVPKWGPGEAQIPICHFRLGGFPTRFGSLAGVPAILGMNRRNPGSKNPGEDAKVGEVGKSYFLIGGGLRIGPQQGPY